MYKTFYGLRARPFAVIPQAEFMFMSPQHRKALSMLQYGLLNRSMFSVITGDIGTGKTTLVRYILARVGGPVTVGLVSNTHRQLADILPWVLFAFGLDHRGKDKAGLYQTLVDFLVGQYRERRRALLIVDEAQNVTGDALEELRVLSNVNCDRYELLQTVLVGQPQLRAVLRDPEFRQLAQRVAVDFHLGPLRSDDTAHYIRHRLRVAGREAPLFTRQACEQVFATSGGVPRVINLVCDLALVYGYAAQKPVIDGDVLEEVLRDKRAQGGWLFDAPAAAPAAAG